MSGTSMSIPDIVWNRSQRVGLHPQHLLIRHGLTHYLPPWTHGSIKQGWWWYAPWYLRLCKDCGKIKHLRVSAHTDELVETAAIAWPTEALEVERVLEVSNSFILAWQGGCRAGVSAKYREHSKTEYLTQQQLLDETNSLVGDEKSG